MTRVFLLALVSLVTLDLHSAVAPGGTASAVPRLAVVISIDQFRPDYLERYRALFGPGGFKRLMDEGFTFAECRYAHASTKTGPGHATILSGVSPDLHGIIANEWYDVAQKRVVVGVEDTDAPLVGLAPARRSPGGVLESRAGRSPRQFLATTVGDQLKLRHRDQARVISVGGKDRAAILMGGKLADGAYWVENGQFVTSRYYREQLPSWVQAFNASGKVDQRFGQTWDRLLAVDLYDRIQGPDDAAGEVSNRNGLTATFPKKIDGGRPQLSPAFYEAFDTTPWANSLLTEFALAAIDAEQLGRDATPDLLCIGYSQPDLAGHAWGPDSHESMDSILRLDQDLAVLLKGVDEKVGLANCVLVVTADHGASPLPERVTTIGKGKIPAGRFDRKNVDDVVNGALTRAFGAVEAQPRWVVRDGNGFHLLPEALTARGVDRTRAVEVVVEALHSFPGIAQVYTRADLAAEPGDGSTLLALARRAYHPARSPDVTFNLAPYYVDFGAQGTTHGLPYDYDRHVPQLWFGAGIRAGQSIEAVGVEDVAPTLAGLLHVSRPPTALGRRLF